MVKIAEAKFICDSFYHNYSTIDDQVAWALQIIAICQTSYLHWQVGKYFANPTFYQIVIVLGNTVTNIELSDNINLKYVIEVKRRHCLSV